MGKGAGIVTAVALVSGGVRVPSLAWAHTHWKICQKPISEEYFMFFFLLLQAKYRRCFFIPAVIKDHKVLKEITVTLLRPARLGAGSKPSGGSCSFYMSNEAKTTELNPAPALGFAATLLARLALKDTPPVPTLTCSVQLLLPVQMRNPAVLSQSWSERAELGKET